MKANHGLRDNLSHGLFDVKTSQVIQLYVNLIFHLGCSASCKQPSRNASPSLINILITMASFLSQLIWLDFKSKHLLSRQACACARHVVFAKLYVVYISPELCFFCKAFSNNRFLINRKVGMIHVGFFIYLFPGTLVAESDM